MKLYFISLSVGLLVGVIYGLLDVRSPAPPVVALIGLLGILLGEQIVPLVRRWNAGEAITIATVQSECASHVFGELPKRGDKPPRRRVAP